MAHWETIDGFFDYPDLYDQFVEEFGNGDVIVEVGSFLGKSACYLGERIKASGKLISVVCVDRWPDVYIRDDGIAVEKPLATFCENIRMAGLQNIVYPFRCDSVLAANILREELAAVFIDADHSYEAVKVDIALWEINVRTGGILAGHDYQSSSFPGVTRAVSELLPDAKKVSFQCWMVRV